MNTTDCSNHVSPQKFILLGLSEDPYRQVICFLLFLVMYILKVLGNLLLIVVVRINPNLQTPMYYLLRNLSVIDFGFSSSVVPEILVNTLSKDRSISLVGCAVQMFAYVALGETECILLAVMAYDRFAAICKPLHYNTIMNKTLCHYLVAGSWSFCGITSAIHVALIFMMPYFRSIHINHFFCEIPPLLQISCRDTRLNEVVVFVSAVIIVVCSFLLTIISYLNIISTILKIRSSQGRQKAFSTCSSHLMVVVLYFGTIMFMYMRPSSAHSPETDKTVSMIYTAVTPMLNPFIYSMRNKEVKGTVKKSFFKLL
ncbi:olfactory receptor 2D3-like [Hyperolius riggenbachi]|uniref:olfactory receptor 2D3-like n=1 Tax=Hyperolius riggenbachi TaxID=752182 RepID=UPI0035A3A05D